MPVTSLIRPPPSDSSDSDEFSFGESKREFRKRVFQPPKITTEDSIYTALMEGNLAEFVRLTKGSSFTIESGIRGKWSPLLFACNLGHIHITKYLIDNGANCDRQIDCVTPIIAACQSTACSDNVAKVVQLLIEKKVIINVSDAYGRTPLMHAVMKRHESAVELIVPHAALDAVDHRGWTALFHAVEANSKTMVAKLMAAGANAQLVDQQGYTPLLVAQFYEFDDVAEILPQPPEECWAPIHYLHYESFVDLVPALSGPSDVPDYFQEIGTLLRGMRCAHLLPMMAKAEISLSELLTITDARLVKLGVDMPFQRKRILFGLYRFHSAPWSRQSVKRMLPDRPLDMHRLYLILAAHLQQLAAIGASTEYVMNNVRASTFGPVSDHLIDRSMCKLDQLLAVVEEIQRLVASRTASKMAPILSISLPIVQPANDWRRRERRLFVASAVGASIYFGCKLAKRILL